MQKKVWFTSDLHFEHKNIIKYCNRPWTFEEQTTQLVDRWNSRVGMDDDVYCLGDFTFDNHKQFNRVVNVIKHLHGNIHFIKGNHCDPALWQMIEDANIPHVIWIKDYAEIKVDGRKIILSHFPFAIWNGSHHGSWHLHGHCHGSYHVCGKILDVGIDNHPDHQVFSFDEVCEHMGKQEFAVKDHHNGER